MTPEGRLLNRVVKLSQKLGVNAIRLSLRIGVTAGWPDLLLLIPGGRPYFLELKAPGKYPTPLQMHRLSLLKDAGYDVLVADNFDAACSAITSALDTASVHGARRKPPDKSHGRRAGP